MDCPYRLLSPIVVRDFAYGQTDTEVGVAYEEHLLKFFCRS